MKFTYCLLITLTVFAVIYLGSLDFGKVTVFDDRSDESLPAQRRNVKLNVVRVPPRKPLAIVEKPEAVRREPVKAIVQAPRKVPPPRQEASSRPATRRVSRAALELQISTSVTEWQARAFLQGQASAVVMLKVQDRNIVDALLIDGEMGAQRLSAWEYDVFKNDHDFDHCFWIRLDNRNNALGEVAHRALQRFHRPTDGYKLYVVLGKTLSGKIQDQLEARAGREGIRPEDVDRVVVSLNPVGSRLVAQVTRVDPRESQTTGEGGVGSTPASQDPRQQNQPVSFQKTEGM